MPFEFKNIGYITSNEITEFILKNEKSYNFGDINDNELVGFDEKSKVYECYIKNRLVGFIILQYMYLNECEYEYEIHIGKLVNDRGVKFKSIFKQFLQNEYKEDLKISAVVKKENPDRERVYNILDTNGFIHDVPWLAECEFVYIPANNCEPT